MVSLKGATMKAIFALSFMTVFLLILTYFYVDNDGDDSRSLDTGIGGKTKRIVNNRFVRLNKRIRYRLVNEHGITVADEQPDFDELNARLNDDMADDNSRLIFNNNKTASLKRPPSNRSGTVIDGIIEHDPTVDENDVKMSYKFYLDGKERLTECTVEAPITKLALLGIHQTGNFIVSNIFYRYGDFKNLYFALPKAPVFEYYWPLRFNPSHVDKSLLHRSKANFIVNAGRNNEARLRSMLSSKTHYLAMFRDPVEHFREIYEYTEMRYYMKMVSTTNKTDIEMFEEFTSDPAKAIDKIMNKTKLFEPSFHLLKNPQLFDLGYELSDYRTPLDLKSILHDLEQQLSLVLLRDYLDESLVLLQRFLCWQLSDMVYLKTSIASSSEAQSESAQIKKNILRWNLEDSSLYSHFNKTFWAKIQEEGRDPMFWADVKKLRETTRKTNNECFTHTETDTNGNILSRAFAKKSHLKVRDEVTDQMRPMCERLALKEKDYVMLLKLKQKQRIKTEYDAIIKANYVTNGTNGKFLYALNSNGSEAEVDKNIGRFVEEKEEIFEKPAIIKL